MVILRQVPGDTVVHRLWAGTKLLAAAGFGIVLSLVPSWPGILIGAALVLAAARLAHIPRTAVPHPPRWFWIALLAGAVVTLASGGRPEVAIGGGAHVGLGDLELYSRFVCLSLVLLGASAMVGWTTPLGEIAPAVARLGGPLRKLHIPVDEWAVAIGLCVRSLPLLLDEARVLVAAWRLRPRPEGRQTLTSVLDELVDLLTAALAASIRRAGEMGEAITARGGTGQLTARVSAPGRADAFTMGVVIVACGAAVGLSTI